jgi:putative multiple sugar transport system substrate-binding protein
MKSIRLKLQVGAALAAAAALALSACTPSPASDSFRRPGSGDKVECNVGITMPTRSLERWIKDGEQLQKELKDSGCKADLQYADNKTDQQISQIQNQIAGGAKILVIASIDGSALSPVLKQAKSQGVTVIAYDRLITGTKDVDYYASFDNEKVGELQGKYIKDKLDLDHADGPINFEPFVGSPDDNNAKFFFTGSWKVLKPYVDKGVLKVPSGKSPKTAAGWAKIGIQGWDSSKAQAEMDNRLSSFYSGSKKVQAILAPADSLSIGIIASLKSAGYRPGSDYPVLTGQDADKANVKAILKGEQSMTIWKDTRTLGDRTFKMIKSIAKGKKPEVNDTKSYDNGKKVVPSYLLQPQVVTKDNVKKKLIDSGFIKPSDVGL